MRRGIATAVTITDPLVKYKSLVSTGVYLPDPAQHRLALHLQKLYARLKDYTPSPEYRARLQQASRALDAARAREAVGNDVELSAPGHPIRRNPLFARLLQSLSAKNGPGGGADTLALTRVLTSHQAAAEADSPRGLFLSGEVGTGKSMLLDILVDGLPTKLKRRWHFNTFMLHAFSRLEQFRREAEAAAVAVHRNGQSEQLEPRLQYSIMWLAREMVEVGPILFLDEFQMPDRTTSKLLSNLFIAFFQLGGVLVASSNRMPEELERASGAGSAYAIPASRGGLVGRILSGVVGNAGGAAAGRSSKGELYGPTSDFATFLEVLKARCDFYHIDGSRDWRRRDMEHSGTSSTFRSSPTISTEVEPVSLTGSRNASSSTPPETTGMTKEDEGGGAKATKIPSRYMLRSDDCTAWGQAVAEVAEASDAEAIPWAPATLMVYGRRVAVPRHHQGATLWDFEDLASSFGPADYITLASSYHTFIVDNVPVLSAARKNEARRFITFLDALYEARCKLVLRAEAGPDDLFFPEVKITTTRQRKGATSTNGEISPATEVEAKEDDDDATYAETIAEVYQDQMAPFRPNISAYENGLRTSRYDPDQDSDFGLPLPAGSTGQQIMSNKGGSSIDFADSGTFTGEDERFAFRRAASRLWELCGARWHARQEPGWWRPLPPEARHWEGRRNERGTASTHCVPRRDSASCPKGLPGGGEGMGDSTSLDEPAGLARHRVEALRKEALRSD